MGNAIETSIDIEAAPATVWGVLTDSEHLAEWSPFLRSLEGDLRPGARLRVVLQPPGGRAMTFHPEVVVADAERELRWKGRLGLPGLFDGEHWFRLEPLDGGKRTRFEHGERFRGVLVPLMGKMVDRAEQGFVEMNQALRDRAEGAASDAPVSEPERETLP
jgi:hypothetical protein